MVLQREQPPRELLRAITETERDFTFISRTGKGLIDLRSEPPPEYINVGCSTEESATGALPDEVDATFLLAMSMC